MGQHFASDRWLDGSGLLKNDVFRLSVFAEPDKHRLAQPLVARQLAKFDLTHQSRFSLRRSLPPFASARKGIFNRSDRGPATLWQ